MLELIDRAKTVCIDADDTTAGYFERFLEYHNSTYGTLFELDDFWTRKFHHVLGCTGEEANQRVDDFQHSPTFNKIIPIEGSVEALTALHSKEKKLYIVTARADYLREKTERFYETYFNGSIQDIIFSCNNHTGAKNGGRTKWEICKSLGAPLIDDDSSYVVPCFERAFGAVLFGRYRWQPPNLPERILRAKTWQEVLIG